MPPSPARVAAFEILLRIESSRAYASELLHSARFKKLSSGDHGLLTELVMGVLRWRSILDSRIAEYLEQPLGKLDLEVLTVLRLGAYQLAFLDRIPQHAAVNESVELVKRARKRSAAALVNAVLRKIQPRGAPTDEDCRSHPEWLVERWRHAYGPQVAAKICAYNQSPPRTVVRINHPAVVAQLERENIRLEPGRLLTQAFVVRSGDITHTQAFTEHRFVIQDEASQLVALVAGNGSSILDCCAAPGGKTRILAERSPKVVALEIHPHRAALLRKRVASPNVQVVAADVRAAPLGNRFERVLVDAPCSGTGTLGRNPEIKWRLKGEDILRFEAYQTEILLAAMKQVSPGGRLTYAVCSLEPEEGPEVIERALAADSSFAVVGCRERLRELAMADELRIEDTESILSGPYLRTIPGVQPTDGFFAALIERR